MKHLLCLLLFACPLWGQAVKLPVEVKGEPGSFVRVPAETADPHVRWYSPDKGLAVFPVELLKDSKTAVVSATKPGRYRLVAWSAKGDVPSIAAECVVVIGDAPPGPGPDPGPLPPSDPFARSVYDAYQKEPQPTRVKDAAALAGLFRALAKDVLTSKDKTPKDVHDTLIQARIIQIGSSLPGVRLVIGTEFEKVLPRQVEAMLDEAMRALFAEHFNRAASALEGINR